MTESSVAYKAIVPSNIAFLKYWGKSDEKAQWPANDSLSMTLSDLNTTTSCQLAAVDSIAINGEDIAEHSSHKAWRHLQYLREHFERSEPLKIRSHNSFPTGCGIASSASGLGAFTTAVLACWFKAESLSELEQHDISLEQLAHLARLGSGSACRSFYGGYVEWLRNDSPEEQSVKQSFKKDHWSLSDAIALFSKTEKTVGSTEAHRAAPHSLLFKPRLAILPERKRRMLAAINNRDLSVLGPLLEEEALEMHAVIMTAQPATHYLTEKSCEFLAWLRKARRDQGCPVYFTIDAGPNIHLIYETKNHDKVAEFLAQQPYTNDFLWDKVGHGVQLFTDKTSLKD